MTTEARHEAPPEKQPDTIAAERPSGSKRFLAYAVVTLSALAVAYTGGRLQTAGKIEQAEQATAKAVEAKTASETHSRMLEGRLHQLEAGRSLQQALVAAEQRNFGIAQTRLQQAARDLEASGVEPNSDLAKLGKSIAEYKLVATDDLGPQRRKMLELVRRLDELVPRR